MGRERRTHRTQPMGGVAAAPREVRLTEPGGAEEPWRLLTRALGRERFKRECWGRIHLCCSFQPRLGFPSQVRVFYLYCLDPCWTSLSPGLSSALQTWEIPLLRLGLLVPPRPLIFTPAFLSWPVISPYPHNCPLPSRPLRTIILAPLCPAWQSTYPLHPRTHLLDTSSWPALPPELTDKTV